MVPQHDEKIVEAMEKQGGSFIQQLVKLLYVADRINYDKLRETFSNYFDDYKKKVK